MDFLLQISTHCMQLKQSLLPWVALSSIGHSLSHFLQFTQFSTLSFSRRFLDNIGWLYWWKDYRYLWIFRTLPLQIWLNLQQVKLFVYFFSECHYFVFNVYFTIYCLAHLIQNHTIPLIESVFITFIGAVKDDFRLVILSGIVGGLSEKPCFSIFQLYGLHLTWRNIMILLEY